MRAALPFFLQFRLASLQNDFSVLKFEFVMVHFKPEINLTLLQRHSIGLKNDFAMMRNHFLAPFNTFVPLRTYFQNYLVVSRLLGN